MKPNLFKTRLSEGRVPVGHMVVEFGTRGMPKILEAAGVDFVVIDAEHSGFGVSQLADMLAWYKATAVVPFVRIPQIDYHFIARTLDLGALGLMVPNVRSAAEARAAVEAAKYPPAGNRGVMLGGALTDFKSVKPRDFFDYANDNTTIICQIESVEGLDNLAEIASTPGVDVLWLGHFDLSVALGIPGQFQDERFKKAVRQVIEVARSHKLAAGFQPRDLEQAKDWLGFGFNVISCSADVFVYAAALGHYVSEVKQLSGGEG